MSVEAEQILREAGAFLEGHFLLTSGLHSPAYWEKFRVLQYPQATEALCRMIAKHFAKEKVQVVAGPTIGGVILAYEVAKQIGVRGIFAEREEQGRAFKRGFTISPGERVLVVDDILTTGGSIREVIAEVKKHGGKLVGVGVLVDRSPMVVDFGAPLFSCHKSILPTYGPQECPLCAARVPLVKLGGS